MLVRLGIEKPSTSFSKLELYGELAKYKKGSLQARATEKSSS